MTALPRYVLVAIDLSLFLVLLFIAFGCFYRGGATEKAGKHDETVIWVSIGVALLILAWQVWARTALSTVQF